MNIAQGFERCAGVTYRLDVTYCVFGGYDDRYPGQLPITLQASVGVNGSTPVVTRKVVWPNNGGGGVNACGDLLMLLDPLAAAPAPGTDGVSLTLSDSFGGFMELYLDNVTVVAMSN